MADKGYKGLHPGATHFSMHILTGFTATAVLTTETSTPHTESVSPYPSLVLLP